MCAPLSSPGFGFDDKSPDHYGFYFVFRSNVRAVYNTSSRARDVIEIIRTRAPEDDRKRTPPPRVLLGGGNEWIYQGKKNKRTSERDEYV